MQFTVYYTDHLWVFYLYSWCRKPRPQPKRDLYHSNTQSPPTSHGTLLIHNDCSSAQDWWLPPHHHQSLAPKEHNSCKWLITDHRLSSYNKFQCLWFNSSFFWSICFMWTVLKRSLGFCQMHKSYTNNFKMSWSFLNDFNKVFLFNWLIEETFP